MVYGQEVIFYSWGSNRPIINDFYPKSANLKDTGIITGDNFSYILSHNKVYFDNIQASVFYATQDTIKVIVPESLAKSNCRISVSIFSNSVIASEDLTFISPNITDLEPKNGTYGSPVLIPAGMIQK
ncbi:MAG: IPT/TIG domain-containing protein [Cyclobacteriaceae bacterium]|nr:IPT/TIG domain-containing protein [Cyclobacteriaceae bacterium]